MIAFEFTDVRTISKRYLQKFGKKAHEEIVKVMKKAGQREVNNTKSRLMTRSTASGDIYNKVADEVHFEIVGDSQQDLPTLRFGAGENFTGVQGSRSKDGKGNIALILAQGFGGATVPKTGLLVKGAKKVGKRIFLSPGKQLPARPPESAFLEKAMKNIPENLEREIPEALRKAFDKVEI